MQGKAMNITPYGVSETLQGIFEALRETPGLSGNKFRMEDVNKVAQYLVCRNYGKACLELGYLCWAVINHQRVGDNKNPLLSFFWVDESITPKRFRNAFSQESQVQNHQISLQRESLSITGSDFHFDISPTRVGVLSVLLEFIVNMRGTWLQEIEDKFVEANDKQIKSFSSELQKELYQYLNEHMPEAQQQRRFRFVCQWLEQEKLSEGFLTDDAILDFWRYASLEQDSLSYTLYSSAMSDLVETHKALNEINLKQNAKSAYSMGLDQEAGEYSPERLTENLFEYCSDDDADCSWMCDTPKFLTKMQWAELQPFYRYSSYSPNITRSILRLAIFGQWQANIVQAKRKSNALVVQKLNESPASYYDTKQSLADICAAIGNVIQAICYIFMKLEDARFIGTLNTFMEESEVQKTKAWMQQQVQSGDLETDLSGIVTSFKELMLSEPAINQAISNCEKSFKNNNKSGFKVLPEVEEIDVYEQGFESLSELQKVIAVYLSWFSETEDQNNGAESIFTSDVSIFKTTFEKIYGAAHAA